jgi:integrase
MKTTSTLSIAKKYINSKNLCYAYSQNLLKVAKSCKNLTSDCINKYLKKRLTQVSSLTAKNNRTLILILCKFAYENNYIKNPIKNILTIKVSKKSIKAWTIEDIKLLITKTSNFDNKKTRSGVSIGLFLRCWILLAYESGARFGDLFNFSRDNLDGNILRWTMSKTGDPMVKILSKKCLEYINSMLETSTDGRILGYVIKNRGAFMVMRKFLDDCSFDGTSKFLRRSGATHIEIDQPGMAKYHLGHRTNGLAEKHYIDYGQIKRDIPKVPEIIV